MTTHLLMIAVLPLLSFALTALSLPLAKRVAGRYGIIAMPHGDAHHREPTPLLGGASILAAILVTLAIARTLPGWMLFGAASLFAVGVIDDAIVLRPLQKFLMQVAIVALVIAFGPPHLALTPWPPLSEALVGFWLLSTINAFNLIDGLDGLAAGVGIAAALAASAVGIVHADAMLTSQGLVIAGALGGFLVCNLCPATIFMGDCGALPLGLLLGIVSLHAGGLAESSRLAHYAVPILIMLVPLLDTAIVSVSRMATGNRISRRGLDHSHHRLLALGLSDQRAVAVCWSVAALSGVCAVILAAMPHAYVMAVLPFIAVLFALIGLFMIDLTFDVRAPGVAYGYLQGVARLILSLSYKRRMTEVALDLILITAAYFGAFLIRLDFKFDDRRVASLIVSLPWVIAATYAAFLVAGIYRGIWRYAGISDVIRFANGAALAGILIVIASVFVPINLSGSIAVLFVILLFNLLVASRLSFRALRKGVGLLALPNERVLVVGAGEIAEAAARYMTSGRSQNLRLVGFVDDDGFKLGKVVHGYEVLGTIEDLERIHKSTQFSEILVAVESLAPERMALVWKFANDHRLAVRRFSILVNVMGFQADTVASQKGSAGQLSKSPAAGKVVA
jgi:UDP-GlcNAc:undecaprenyl-phosphate/decaprenyl-phosphate GlcNAc-1-phosphate transferase